MLTVALAGTPGQVPVLLSRPRPSTLQHLGRLSTQQFYFTFSLRFPTWIDFKARLDPQSYGV